MTARTREVLKTAFETGDVPVGSDYADVLDSYYNLTNTTAQVANSDLTVPNLYVTQVVRYGGVPIFAHTTTAVSTSTSATKMVLITVSGVSYALKAYKI